MKQNKIEMLNAIKNKMVRIQKCMHTIFCSSAALPSRTFCFCFLLFDLYFVYFFFRYLHQGDTLSIKLYNVHCIIFAHRRLLFYLPRYLCLSRTCRFDLTNLNGKCRCWCVHAHDITLALTQAHNFLPLLPLFISPAKK